ncbi:Hypothetical predicted protein [Mytilus galloprovincialis]|uniref:Uncharacterized protein n=1 Tax=Mytilus galloprovincialis TaxID=29158 RepID=A0A8B6CR28_MYTGA|nr:Hypothetical predicted protein [Mytilus galloprovincialis]
MDVLRIYDENSECKVPDTFNELEQEFLKFPVVYKYILLNGDFSSRTSRDVEYIEIVHSQHDIVDTDNVDILNNLELYDMSKVRCIMDTNLVAELESVDSNILSQGKINEVIEKINSIFLDAADNVLGTYNASQGGRTGGKMCKKGNKPWFDNHCWNKRKTYRGAKRNYNSNRSEAKREDIKRRNGNINARWINR